MTQDKLVEQYSGAGASGYDERRAVTPRFQAEEASFARLFDQVDPEWVIDCPFGTGRWLEQYRGVAGPVVGIDASEAMLAVAAEKCRNAGVDVEMKVGSIFDQALFADAGSTGKGLMVCIRFLNWVPMARATEALASISQCKAEYMIVGASLRPAGWGFLRSLRSRWELLRRNLRELRDGKQRPYVHSERGFHEAVANCGWNVLSKEFIYNDAARENYFFLLKRMGAK